MDLGLFKTKGVNGQLFITIKHLFSLNQLFDFFVLVAYLKPLVKSDDYLQHKARNQGKNNQSINNIYSDFKTQEINLQLQKVSKLQSKVRVEKRVIKHL